jgi:hypothetical protein
VHILSRRTAGFRDAIFFRGEGNEAVPGDDSHCHCDCGSVDLSSRVDACREVNEMELKDCKFYYGGEGLNFAVFSDDACRTKFLDSIHVSLAQTTIQVYEIEPGVNSQWVVVRQVDGKQDQIKLYVRQGESFLEENNYGLSRELRTEIEQKFPRLISGFLSVVA